eukprot:3621312-Amphidinium_carterae.1
MHQLRQQRGGHSTTVSQQGACVTNSTLLVVASNATVSGPKSSQMKRKVYVVFQREHWNKQSIEAQGSLRTRYSRIVLVPNSDFY